MGNIFLIKLAVSENILINISSLGKSLKRFLKSGQYSNVLPTLIKGVKLSPAKSTSDYTYTQY